MRKLKTAYSIGLVLAIISLGCSHKFKMPREYLDHSSKWQYHRYDTQNTGQIEGAFSGRLSVIWEKSTGTLPSGPLTLSRGHLIYPDSKKKIRFYLPSTGDYKGFIRSKGHTPTGMVVVDSLGYFVDGPRRIRLHCVNLLKRKKVWEADVKDAVSGSIIVNNKLIISQTTGLIQAFDLQNGRPDWTFTAKERFLVPPAFFGNRIYQSGDDGTLYVLSADSGLEKSRLELPGPFLGTAAIDNLIYMVNMNGEIFAIDKESDSVIWELSVEGPIWSSPATDSRTLFVTSNVGQVSAINSVTGEIFWQFDAGEVIKSSPIVVGNTVVFGTMYGHLYALNSASGAVLAKREFKGAISESAISDGRFIYVATDEGELYCLGDTSEIAALKN